MLSEGKGEPTLIASIHVPTRATVVGALYDERTCHLKRETGHRDYIPVDDIAALYEAAARDLMKMSPHPPDACIAAVHKKYVTKVPVSLIRTPQANQEIEGDLRVAAEAERARSEVASRKVDELAELQANGKLSGETYVARIWLSSGKGSSSRARAIQHSWSAGEPRSGKRESHCPGNLRAPSRSACSCRYLASRLMANTPTRYSNMLASTMAFGRHSSIVGWSLSWRAKRIFGHFSCLPRLGRNLIWNSLSQSSSLTGP
jgi:hypothetical protein